MTRSKWNVGKVALVGGICGAFYGIARTMMNVPGAPAKYYVGSSIGGIVAGALLFGAVALIRNWAAGRA